jgi:hypothetical protein
MRISNHQPKASLVPTKSRATNPVRIFDVGEETDKRGFDRSLPKIEV